VHPHRVSYRGGALGGASAGSTRTDIQIVNQRGQRLAVSLYRKEQYSAGVVLCLHGISGCRLDFTCYERVVLAYRVDMASLDFAGSGVSEGDHVSLGLREKEDLAAVYEYLRGVGYEQVFLFGRSMGAVTSILFLHAYPALPVAGLILDSPYYSFADLYREYGAKLTQYPELAISMVYGLSRSLISWRYGFDIGQSTLEGKAQAVACPTALLYSPQDEFISPQHSLRLYS
jgi:pimeloyl-ACP methyl ester carboxylesterase